MGIERILDNTKISQGEEKTGREMHVPKNNDAAYRDRALSIHTVDAFRRSRHGHVSLVVINSRYRHDGLCGSRLLAPIRGRCRVK